MTPNIRTSDGMSLANSLYDAVDEYRMLFGEPPSLIELPYFRSEEIDDYMTFLLPTKPGESLRFCGIPIQFTSDSNCISLHPS